MFSERTQILPLQTAFKVLEYAGKYQNKKDSKYLVRAITEAAVFTGLPAPKMVKMWDTIHKIANGKDVGENVFNLFTGINLGADGIPLSEWRLKMFQSSQSPYEGETMNKYIERMKELESYLNERDRKSNPDKYYESIFYAYQYGGKELVDVITTDSNSKIIAIAKDDKLRSKYMKYLNKIDSDKTYREERRSRGLLDDKVKLYKTIKKYGYNNEDAEEIFKKVLKSNKKGNIYDGTIPNKKEMEKYLEN
jgi:hypothetical protein